MFYDALLLFSLLFVGSFLVLPFTSGEAVASDNVIYPSMLFAACYGYFVWQWMHGGQTLGMRAWQCRVEANDHQALSLRAATLRFFLAVLSLALLGLGVFMALTRKDNMALHDLYSDTRLVYIP